MPSLYIIPTTLANPINGHVLLAHDLLKIQYLKYFIVETAKIGRQHLKHLHLNTTLQNLSIQELNKHNSDLLALVKPLLDGHDMGLLSDCGLPAIADPGNKVIHLANSYGVKIKPIVGPSSLFMALMASGVNGQSFAFSGYLPINKDERLLKIDKLQKLIELDFQSQIIIEAPFRNQQLLELLIKKMPNHFILSLAVNLMSSDEQIINHNIAKWKSIATLPNIHKAEVVFVIGV